MKLEQLVNQLPKHSSENDLWEGINKKLNQPTTLADKLPIHNAKTELWFNIDQHLEKRHKQPMVLVRRIFTAASIVLFIGLNTIFINKLYTPKEIYYTEEVYIQEDQTERSTHHAVDFKENCSSFPAVCNNPNFTRLKSNLDHLKIEEEKLFQLKGTVNDPMIDVYHARIVNDIQQIEAKLLQMFI